MSRARIGRVALLLACALALGACASHNKRPEPAPLPENVDLIGVHEVWSSKLPAVDFPLEPRVIGNRVTLAGGDGTVVVLDAASGQELSRASAGARLAAGVGSDGTTAAVVTRDNQVVALRDGQVLWKHPITTQTYTAPLVAGGRVFVLGADRSVTALDGNTGTQLWRLERPGEPLVLQGAGVLLAAGNTLVAGLSGRLVGINPDIGSVIWEAPIASPRGTNDVERLVDLVAGVDRQGSVVCARAFQASVGCVDTADGRLLWSHAADGASGIAGDAERVYGAEADGRVVAWQAASGEPAWSTDMLKWRTLTGALVLGRSVIFGDSTGLVYFLSRDNGRPLNRLSTDRSGIAATPAVAGNTLVVVTRAGSVHGYAPR